MGKGIAFSLGYNLGESDDKTYETEQRDHSYKQSTDNGNRINS